jgi:hypothetical protein
MVIRPPAAHYPCREHDRLTGRAEQTLTLAGVVARDREADQHGHVHREDDQ